MSLKIFCKIEGIAGESTDKDHKDYFEVESFSHMLHQPGSGCASGSGFATGGYAQHGELQISKLLDKSSPKIWLSCAKGTPLKSVLLECWRAIDENKKFLEIKLTKAAISSVQYSGSPGQPRPVENIDIAYAKIEWKYFVFDNSGKPNGDIPAGWDCEKNTTV